MNEEYQGLRHMVNLKVFELSESTIHESRVKQLLLVPLLVTVFQVS